MCDTVQTAAIGFCVTWSCGHQTIGIRLCVILCRLQQSGCAWQDLVARIEELGCAWSCADYRNPIVHNLVQTTVIRFCMTWSCGHADYRNQVYVICFPVYCVILAFNFSLVTFLFFLFLFLYCNGWDRKNYDRHNLRFSGIWKVSRPVILSFHMPFPLRALPSRRTRQLSP